MSALLWLFILLVSQHSIYLFIASSTAIFILLFLLFVIVTVVLFCVHLCSISLSTHCCFLCCTTSFTTLSQVHFQITFILLISEIIHNLLLHIIIGDSPNSQRYVLLTVDIFCLFFSFMPILPFITIKCTGLFALVGTRHLLRWCFVYFASALLQPSGVSALTSISPSNNYRILECGICQLQLSVCPDGIITTKNVANHNTCSRYQSSLRWYCLLYRPHCVFHSQSHLLFQLQSSD